MTGNKAGTIVLVGCGQMGSAMLRGWLRGDAAERFVVDRAGRHAGRAGRRRRRSNGIAPRRRCRPISPPTRSSSPSSRRSSTSCCPPIAAGCGRKRCFCRSRPARRSPASPAISAARRRSSAACRTRRPRSGARSRSPARIRMSRREQRRLCEQLLAAIGDSAWVEDEALMDAVTAVSGSGPAYVFLLIEALAAAGARAGLPPDLSLRLARATVAGAGRTGAGLVRDAGPAARECHQPRRHDPRRARRADGRARDCRNCSTAPSPPRPRARASWRTEGARWRATRPGDAPEPVGSETDRLINAALRLIAHARMAAAVDGGDRGRGRSADPDALPRISVETGDPVRLLPGGSTRPFWRRRSTPSPTSARAIGSSIC